MVAKARVGVIARAKVAVRAMLPQGERISPIRSARRFRVRSLCTRTTSTSLAIVCMLTSRLPPQGMDVHLASALDGWAVANPEPYLGLHWPEVDR